MGFAPREPPDHGAGSPLLGQPHCWVLPQPEGPRTGPGPRTSPTKLCPAHMLAQRGGRVGTLRGCGRSVCPSSLSGLSWTAVPPGSLARRAPGGTSTLQAGSGAQGGMCGALLPPSGRWGAGSTPTWEVGVGDTGPRLLQVSVKDPKTPKTSRAPGGHPKAKVPPEPPRQAQMKAGQR